MEQVIEQVIEKLQGERFVGTISGFDFDIASQITILLYKSSETGFIRSWLKNPNSKYPQANLVTKNIEDGKMYFTVDLEGLPTGNYELEARVDVVGVVAPIIKKRSKFLTINPSRT